MFKKIFVVVNAKSCNAFLAFEREILVSVGFDFSEKIFFVTFLSFLFD